MVEMESSRRSIERSREQGLKKPRLAEEAERDRGSNSIIDRDRPFPARVSSAGGAGALNSRFRERGEEREGREDSVRITSQQHQELVGQYKTAIAELTFNSKPIITNLTIIAGENLHAAKGIAATVCTNILEVPSEQKLPSLYLLDSIVKNIGRDYIKYFAAKLPEVFCKAYRQVDSSVHPGMRHLFGTWKGVFPPAPLQIIEKELGFQTAVNGSSSGITTSRPDSQSQRPLHSIHVNPKYLEARQRLQQSSRAKGDSTGSTVTSGVDAERPERKAILGSAKPWADLPVKMHNIQHAQKGQSNEQDHEKNPDAGYGDYDLIADLPQHSDLESQRATERATEREGFHKPWYGSGSNVPDVTIGRRNGFDTHAYENYDAPRPTQAVNQLHSTQNNTDRSSRGMSRNWKNSEEEEYIWDDIKFKFRDRAEADNSRKDGWNHNNSEKPPSLQSSKWMPLGTNLLDCQWKTGDSFFRLEKSSKGGDRASFQRDIEDGLQQPCDQQVLRSKINRETSTDSQYLGLGRQAVFGQTLEMSNDASIGPIIAGQLEDRLTFLSGSLSKSMNTSLVRTGFEPHMEPSVSGSMSSDFGSLANRVSGSLGMFGHQQQHPRRPVSPTALSSLHQRSHSPSPGPPHQHEKSSHNLTDPDNPQSHSFPQAGQKPLQIAGYPNRAPDSQVIQDPLPLVSQNQVQPGMVSQSPQQHLQSSLSSVMPFTQQRPHLPFSLIPQPEFSQSSSQTKKPLLQPLILGTRSMVGPSDSNQSSNPVSDLSVQSNTGSLLATIMKSGLISNNSVINSFPNASYPDLMMPSNSNIQPPLPTGPPPIQLAASSSWMSVTPASVLGPTLTAHSPLRALIPPLPPGPPPASSLVVTTSSQMSIPASAAQNPLSSLLSSLVAKGLISAPEKESPTQTTPQMIRTQVENQTVVGLSTSTSLQVSTSSPSFAIPSPSANELPFSESTKRTTVQSKASIQKRKDLIGTEFRPDIIRELHPEVIHGLFDDIPHQCSNCSCRFELQEQLSRHLDWHASKKHELSSSTRVSRKWYLRFSEWVTGNTGPSIGPVDTPSMKGVVEVTGKCEVMVPADESQCICALCGEPFEDFYSDERDEWMYKGAVYMEVSAGEGDKSSTNGHRTRGPIVHAICMSKSPTDDLEEA